ncbi:hypothetical protein BGZ49_009600 [Haplosporangium sp. Z 27]|nr:hypothetical protein BGZ49_009600 [Haplosporangium sp. Z 27]
MVRLIIGLAACAAMALADVTFNVVGLRDNAEDEFGVMVKGKLTKLTTTEETYPLWSANVAGVDGPLEYKYVHIKDGKNNEEKTARKLPDGAAYTPNDFYGRTTTIRDLPPLPQVYENHLQQNSPFFRQGYIGNIFVEGDVEKWNELNKAGDETKPYKVSVRYIGANDDIKIEGVKFDISGQSAREYAKLAYQFKFPKKNRLLDLGSLKLRNEETDATMIREKVYVDILNSLGVPAQQAAYVRLFYNGEPVGLYVAVEEMKKHWIKSVLHPGIKKDKVGSLWKMNSCCGKEGNLQWLGPKSDSYVLEDIYKNILKGTNPKDDPMKDLIQFMADLKDYDPKKVQDPIAFWEKKLDLDLFLKSMAMEYLTGSWDSYWISGSNYQFYNDPVTGKWTWLPTDFDDTFGTSFEGKVESYRKIPKVNSNGFESPLAQKLIMETPAINARFETILKDIVNYVFKPEALSPRLDAYKNMIEEDIAWDRALPRLHKGKNNKFNTADLTKGLASGTKDGWGVKNWVDQRSAIVQKDLKFKAVAGNPTKIEYHAMSKLESPFGVIASQSVTSAGAPAAAPAASHGAAHAAKPKKVPASGDKTQAPISIADVKNEAPTSKESQRITKGTANKTVNVKSSAATIKGQWTALGAVLAIAVLAL